MIKYLGNVEVDFYVSPQEPIWGCYLRTGKPCFSLRGLPPQPPTQASPSIGCIGHVSTPSQHQQKHCHLYYLVFSGLHWSNCSGSIFQPAAFVSKQLYLLGYGLCSPALSLLFYRLSLSFGSVAYGTYDSRSRRKSEIYVLGWMWIKRGDICVSRKVEKEEKHKIVKKKNSKIEYIKRKSLMLCSSLLRKRFMHKMTKIWHNLV